MSTTTTTTRFTDRAFVRSHGHQPRGRGCWAFQAATSHDAWDHSLVGDITFVPDSTLGEAKTEIRRLVISGEIPAAVVWAVLP